MNKKIELLDCTLRDGAYICKGEFGKAAIKGMIKNLQNANIDIIECGWLKDFEHRGGSTYYHIPDDVLSYIGEKNEKTDYVAMIDWDRYNLDKLPVCDGKSINAIKVAFPQNKFKEGIALSDKIKSRGYKVYLQAVNTLGYTDGELIALAEEVNRAKPVCISIADTFGAMYPEDLSRILSVLDSHLDEGIKIGFHSHNNQQLSFALSMQFIDYFSCRDREIIVDASLCGMGRGAGNATTELVASYLNKKHNGNYDMDVIMDTIDTYMQYFLEKFEWGYSIPYFVAGMYCCHVNNIEYLRNKHSANAKELYHVIESLSAADRKKYDYDLLEDKYKAKRNH